MGNCIDEQMILSLPKAELHVHIEGTLEPEMIFKFAHRNNTVLPYANASLLKKAYDFTNLQSFLNIYYAGAGSLIKEQDFYEMTYAYLVRAWADNVRHAEIFFDPQTHTSRGVSFETIINGLSRACKDFGGVTGMTSGLIMCFLRHLSEDEAITTYHQMIPFRDKIIGVGLDSSEVGHPPSKFARVFAMAKSDGLHLVAHAGEEGPSEYIWEALNLLKVERIDHGVRCLEDPNLVSFLRDSQTTLTVCPLSNVKLRVFDNMSISNLPLLLKSGLRVTINSDDPSYFGGYINDNYRAVFANLSLNNEDAITMAKNSFKGAFISEQQKSKYLALF